MWEEESYTDDSSLDDWDPSLDSDWSGDLDDVGLTPGGGDVVEDCWECGGTETIICPDCEGDGERLCGACGGSGYTAEDVNCEACEGYGVAECHECGTSGETRCPEC